MDKIKYVYILSQRYSGSTLLSFLLGTHPEISTIGERRKFYTHSFGKSALKQSCSCGQLFPDCEHWNEVKKGLLEKVKIDDYQTNPTEFRLYRNRYINKLAFEVFKFLYLKKWPIPFRKKIEKLCHFNSVLVKEILKKDGGKVFLDSSKVIDHTLFLSSMDDLDIYIVWLTRDPRAQVNSALKYNDWTVKEATDYWKKEMVNNSTLLDKMNVKYTVLNYEALCRNPQKEMTSILDFLKMDSNSFSLNFRENTQHIMGNYNMRLGTDSTIVERKEWMDDLPEDHVKEIEELTKDYKMYYTEHV